MLALYKIFKFIFRYLLPTGWRYPAARFIARLVFRFNKARRRTILGNLTPLVGAEEARRIGPKMLGSFLMTAVDFFCARPSVMKAVQLEGWHILDKAYRKTRRVMIVTAHLGHWELGIPCIVSRGYSVAGMYAPYREDDVVQWILSHRDSDVEWFPAARGAVEASIDALARGRILGMVGDIPFGEKGRRVRIAGAYAHLPLGPWAIAARAKATVIPGFVIRQAPGIYKATLFEAIAPVEGSFRKQIEHMQNAYVSHLEKYLQAYPEQWGVLQPFWDS